MPKLYITQSIGKLLLLVALVFCVSGLYAQTGNITMNNLAEVKVDELSDEQIKQFITEYKNNGYTLEQVLSMAAKRKMPAEEQAKLRMRVEKADVVNNKPVKVEPRTLSKDAPALTEKSDVEIKPEKLKIFGAELFTNKNLSFEPNLKIATPANYQLGPDDELLIDIYGNSEATYSLKVSPEGVIRIPNLGPIQVSGLTIEQARKKIIAQLSTIYSGIGQNQTSVAITLASIRSIKVSILGEVTLPGTYTLSSLATVFNALYVSGGPNKNGSFRHIKVIRNGKVVASLDVYDYLLNGTAKGNIRLQDQDVIKVSPYGVRVELKGAVKREALYEVNKNETLKDILNFAGNFTDAAYRERIKVTRFTNKEKSVADIPSEMYGMFTPQTGDVFEVGEVIDRFANRIIIRGAVFRPGFYAEEDGLTVSKLIKKADGLKEDAFTSRAIIYRLKEDNTREVLSFDVMEALGGVNDYKLKREDIVVINSKLEMKEESSITIQGAVITPGKYPFASNSRVEDLIVAAGGLKDYAAKSKIEIARINKGDGLKSGSEIALLFNYSVNDSLTTNSDFYLQPNDVITVYAIPGYTKQQNVTIEGEVQFPGRYAITNKQEKISDLIKRAGGLTEFGFVDGAVLIRKRKLSEAEKTVRDQKLEALLNQTTDSLSIKKIIEEDQASNTSIVGIDLKEILKNPGSAYDLLLLDGDLISIPLKKQTILVSGEVLYPIRIQYNKRNSFKSYINGAGGYTFKALKKSGYVVYANGTVKSTNSFLGIKFHPKVKPGSEIVIPPKDERKKLTSVETVTILTSLTTMTVLLITLFK